MNIKGFLLKEEEANYLLDHEFLVSKTDPDFLNYINNIRNPNIVATNDFQNGHFGIFIFEKPVKLFIFKKDGINNLDLFTSTNSLHNIILNLNNIVEEIEFDNFNVDFTFLIPTTYRGTYPKIFTFSYGSQKVKQIHISPSIVEEYIVSTNKEDIYQKIKKYRLSFIDHITAKVYESISQLDIQKI